MHKAAIILCGGKSSRMGRDKATLPFGPELMLQRVVRLIGQAVDLERRVIVAAPNQSLPALPTGATVAHDAAEYRGPLQGLATGLRPGLTGVAAGRVSPVTAAAASRTMWRQSRLPPRDDDDDDEFEESRALAARPKRRLSELMGVLPVGDMA